MRRSMLAAFSLLCLSGLCAAQDQPTAAALERLRALSGNWEGFFEWSGARSDKGAMNASYYVTGNGSAVVENLISGGVPVMTSVYHLDGGDLRMTHFCVQNQPRLKASRIDPEHGIVNFTFIDITNLRSPEIGHVVGLELRFVAADHVTLTFRFEAGKKRSSERIDLKRVAT